ncbi:MAG: Na/Pi symporter [Clostridia bacterium]|nr:Na/Pi symporter [Clostridia bacterium]
MSISDVIGLVTGIALFLFGMTLMGDGLKSMSGNKLEPVLYRLSDKRFKGLLLGAGVTAVIQSSSATSVIVMGFVSSSLMRLRQAIPVILGAIFGTSVTGWVICLSYIEGAGSLSAVLSTATLTCAAAASGVALRVFFKGKSQRHVGDLLMGFSILLLGMSLMSSSVSAIKEAAWFDGLLSTIENPFLGILIGAAAAAALQSASAAIGIVQALCAAGAVSFGSALPLLMGISIGAALPVMIASLGTSRDGRRAALSYLLLCVFGVGACAAIYYALDAIFSFGLGGLKMTPFSLSAANTLLRLVMVLLLFPLLGAVERLIGIIIPEKPETERKIYIDERLLSRPPIAIEQVRSMVTAMARDASQAISEAGSLYAGYSEESYRNVEELETNGDLYEDVLGSFLLKLTGLELSDRQATEATVFLHMLSNFERVSDHAMSIANGAKEMYEAGLSFSDEAGRDLTALSAAVREVLKITVRAFSDEDLDLAARVEPLEQVVDRICDEMKLRHIERMQRGVCGVRQGFVWGELITNYERVSDHCSNVAAALIEIYSGSLATHEYLGHVKKERDGRFEQLYAEYSERFLPRGFGTENGE